MRSCCVHCVAKVGAIILLAAPVLARDYPQAMVTARVVDEEGNVLQGAEVQLSFDVAKPTEWGDDSIVKKGLSDKEGLFAARGEGAPWVSISAEKKGYYIGGLGFHFKNLSPDNRWEPWNPTVDLTLKRIRNPVPMYAQYTDFVKVPVLDQAVGYDLEIGDWVVPYGKGIARDFVFTFHARQRSFSDYDCGFLLTFSGEHDGIQEYPFAKGNVSYYKWPFEAPETGYVRILQRQRSDTPSTGLKSDAKEGINYIFRVRTEVDTNGKLVRAKYGKILREFKFDPDASIAFSYWFNPDGTRNLEFDPKRNLFNWSREDEDKHRLREP